MQLDGMGMILTFQYMAQLFLQLRGDCFLAVEVTVNMSLQKLLGHFSYSLRTRLHNVMLCSW